MNRDDDHTCPGLAENPIFARPIPRSSDPTLLPSILPAGVAEDTFASAGRDAGADAIRGMLVQSMFPASIPSKHKRRFDLYVTMSVLQKAIRLGEYQLAASAAEQMVYAGQSSALWRRLRTIAVEDVGLGDINVMAFVLWLAARADLRDGFGSLPLARLVIGLMCRAVKSRDMADIAYWANLPGSIDHLMPGFGDARSSELVTIASDEGQAFQTRHAAARALFPARFGMVQPWKRRSPKDRTALYEALGTPYSLSWAIERDIAFGGDVLTSTGPIAWALLQSSQTISAGFDPFEPAGTELIGGVLASSFDRHTRLGKAVLSKMLREHHPWADFFARHKQASAMDCVMRGLFYIEGGVLRPRLSYDHSEELYWAILQAKLASTGITSMDDGGYELLDLVLAVLPEINQRRRRSVADTTPSERTSL